ncbi:MAG: tRNA glutamyl-Q(34) synthetase GluQRS [Pseudaminobacter sp.]|nr:tRNA glutamyl-Q(34) synthetase GluQRS [Pseudaminobacter sp.]
MNTPVFRFAPSPNGDLHLGHGYSALLNAKMAKAAAGRLLLRIEDIDVTRCTPQCEAGIFRDLTWLGVKWEEPVRRQSEHFDVYEGTLKRLIDDDLVYPAFMSRGEVRAFLAETGQVRDWPRDPDGAPHYPPMDKNLPRRERARRIEQGAPFAWRLDMDAAMARLSGPLSWTEFSGEDILSASKIEANPREWGDAIMARREIPTSYHLSVVTDDALQNISHVVRGQDLYASTSIHRLLQRLLGLPEPRYFHHRLILGPDGRKLSKSLGDSGLSALRAEGASAADVRAAIRFEAP